MPPQAFPAAFDCLLAQAQGSGSYFSIFKVLLYTLCAFLVWHNAAWVDKDTAKIGTSRPAWNSAIFGTGTLCIVVWLVVPLFWVGFVIYVVAYGAAIVSYSLFHNSRVAPAETVLTMAHLRRLTTKKAMTDDLVHGQDRVRIRNHEGKTPAWPTDPQLHTGYAGLQELLFDAIWRRASDVRLDLTPDQPVRIAYKVDGVDRAREPIDPLIGPVIFRHFKDIAGMNAEEHRRPQSGRFRATIGAGSQAEKKVDIEIKTSGNTAGERIILKMFSEEAKFRLADLGFTEAQLKVFEPLVLSSRYVILITGPKSSGVTSTMYALLRAHDAFIQNINTIETAKAIDLENVTQNVFDGRDGTVTFAKRFHSMLRTDPDVAMAGEIPDADTAKVAAEYGRQGKRIYLGMAAKDTFSALRQFAHYVGDAAGVAGCVVAITNQRLIRKLCQNCRKAYRPDPSLLKKANLPIGDNRPFFRPPNPNEVEVDKQGNPIICPVCQGSGYLGRTAVFELLILDESLKKMVASGTSLNAIKAEARKRGMMYLQEIALQKVIEGTTSVNEVLRVTREETPAAG